MEFSDRIEQRDGGRSPGRVSVLGLDLMDRQEAGERVGPGGALVGTTEAAGPSPAAHKSPLVKSASNSRRHSAAKRCERTRDATEGFIARESSESRPCGHKDFRDGTGAWRSTHPRAVANRGHPAGEPSTKAGATQERESGPAAAQPEGRRRVPEQSRSPGAFARCVVV